MQAMAVPEDDHTHSLIGDSPGAFVEQLEADLVARGLLDPSALDDLMATYFAKDGWLQGAQAVARAWLDPAFKELLLTDAPAAFSRLGITNHDKVVVVENTADVHNVVVCTLCSCYPFWIMGLSPRWYRSLEYRARVVREPRVVLAEFGLKIAAQRQVRVWDSSSDVRYMVLPLRPSGSEAANEVELTQRVTRDSLIGTAELFETASS
jgi:nitrile hydratase subunit alpha